MHNKSFILIIISILSNANGLASFNFFPHQERDLWVYEVISWDYTVYYQFKTEVILDSTNEIGISYITMKEHYSTYNRYSHYIIDTTGNVYTATPDFTLPILYYRTKAQVGDKWALGIQRPNEFAELHKMDEEILFGLECQIQRVLFFHADSLNDTTDILHLWNDRLSDKFGLIRRGGGDTFETTYLKGVFINGVLYGDTTLISSLTEIQDHPSEIILNQNYPNPFNPVTKISFQIPKTEHVKLDVYDTSGRLVETILDKNIPAGHHIVEFEDKNLSSGIYIYRIKTKKYSETKKMIYLK
jgi:hypothetical protein